VKAAPTTSDDGLKVRSEEKTRADGDFGHQLVWHGMFLFLLGVLTGLVEQNLPTRGWDWRHTWKV
jgi:hypothetical protein